MQLLSLGIGLLVVIERTVIEKLHMIGTRFAAHYLNFRLEMVSKQDPTQKQKKYQHETKPEDVNYVGSSFC